MKKKKIIVIAECIVLVAFFFAIFSWFFQRNTSPYGYQEYIPLAQSFLHGMLDIPPEYETSPFNGKHYWPLGPLPGILLIPFVLVLKEATLQGHLALVLHFITFFTLVVFANKSGLKKYDPIWFALAFFGGSMYMHVGINPTSWYLAHIVAVCMSFLSLYFFFSKKNYVLSAVFLSLAGASRPPVYLLILFFVLEIIRGKFTKKINLLKKFLAPIVISLLIIAAYNYARFQNPFESGYHYQQMNEVFLPQYKEGFFSIVHIPANIYYLFLKSPEAIIALNTTAVLKFPYFHVNPWGLGIFFTSPVLFLLFFLNLKSKTVQNALITLGIALVPLLTYFGIGWYQYGFRNALDFYPLLYLLLLLKILPKIAFRTKLLISLSTLFNLFLLSFCF